VNIEQLKIRWRTTLIRLERECEQALPRSEEYNVKQAEVLLLKECMHDVTSCAGIPMILTCPSCGDRHIDEGEWAEKIHHTHACQHCGTVWRPAVVPTVGVQFLPGFKNEKELSDGLET